MADAPIPATQTIAAVLADVDGTLVTKAKALTPRAIEAIERLHERGVLFAITSGRPPRGMRMLVHPLEMRGPMAAFNGGITALPSGTSPIPMRRTRRGKRGPCSLSRPSCPVTTVSSIG